MERDKQLKTAEEIYLEVTKANMNNHLIGSVPMVTIAMEAYAQQQSSHLQSIIEEKEREVDVMNGKLKFYTESTDILREYCDNNKIGTKGYNIFERVHEHLQSRLSSNEAVTDELFKKVFDIFYDTNIKYHEAEEKIKSLLVPFLSKQTDRSDAVGFELAMDYINKCPCDPDITSEQLEAWGKLQEYLKSK